jgi:hypothetical protein
VAESCRLKYANLVSRLVLPLCPYPFSEATPDLIVEAVTNFGINFPWIVPVEAAERLAVVQIHPATSYIQGIQ